MPDWVSLPVFAKREGASKQRVRHHARTGLFGPAARRAADGSWEIDPVEGARRWRTGRDLNTAPMQVVLDEAARIRESRRSTPAAPVSSAERVVVYSGPGGRCECPESIALALEAAEASPDEALLSPEMIAHLDRILICAGDLPKDFPVGSPIEVEPLNEGGAS